MWFFVILIVSIVAVAFANYNFKNVQDITLNLDSLVIQNNKNSFNIFHTINYSICLLLGYKSYTLAFHYMWLIPNILFIATTLYGIYFYKYNNWSSLIWIALITTVCSIFSYVITNNTSELYSWIIPLFFLFFGLQREYIKKINYIKITIMFNFLTLASYFISPQLLIFLILFNLWIIWNNIYYEINNLQIINFIVLFNVLFLISLQAINVNPLTGHIMLAIIFICYILIIFLQTIPFFNELTHKIKIPNHNKLKIINVLLMCSIVILIIIFSFLSNPKWNWDYWTLTMILNKTISISQNTVLYWIINSIYWGLLVMTTAINIFYVGLSIKNKEHNSYKNNYLSVANNILIANPISLNLLEKLTYITPIGIQTSLILNTSIIIDSLIYRLKKCQLKYLIIMYIATIAITIGLCIFNIIG